MAVAVEHLGLGLEQPVGAAGPPVAVVAAEGGDTTARVGEAGEVAVGVVGDRHRVAHMYRL